MPMPFDPSGDQQETTRALSSVAAISKPRKKKRRRLPTGPDACVLCGKPDPSPYLNPSKCVQKVGARR